MTEKLSRVASEPGLEAWIETSDPAVTKDGKIRREVFSRLFKTEDRFITQKR